jgi:hypothetical protein
MIARAQLALLARALADLSRIERYEIRASTELCGALRKLLSSSGRRGFGKPRAVPESARRCRASAASLEPSAR